ncbi:hypothetical protein F183_A17310 [Bryobacterales bacterium F-183]|nr:hypothetical protein F183_A17310 [Bryobacterales bacterium F-183]
MKQNQVRSAAVMALAILFSAAAAYAQDKLAPSLRGTVAEAENGRVPVFVLLADQPQRAIADNLRMESMRDRSLRAEAAFQSRFQAELEQAVRPAQDRVLGKLRSAGAIREGRYTAVNMVTVEVPPSALQDLASDPEVAFVFPARKRVIQELNNTPTTMGATTFWNANFTGGGQSIALLDTGVRTDHPAFVGKSISSRRFLTFGAADSCYEDDSSTSDLNGHGTHIAGILMSQGSTGFTNFQGIAKGLGTLYNYKAGYVVKSSCNGGARADDRDLVDAMNAAATAGIPIINLSFGTALNPNEDEDTFAQVVDQISDVNDIFFAVAAGNQGTQTNAVNSPAVAYNVMAVANWNSTAGKSIQSSSSRGPTVTGRNKPDIAAPGSAIVSTSHTWNATSATSDDFAAKTGTSMATPHIAAGAALIRQAGITDPLQIKALMLNSTDETDWAADRGWGYVNLTTAFAQRTFLDSLLIATSGFQLYNVSGAGALKATLTWNRHVDGSQFALRFNNLGLYAYNRASGAQLAASNTDLQNVERINISAGSDTIVKVDTEAGNATAEFYGIAFSRAMTKVSPPALSVSCTQPSSATAGTAFSGTCSVSNTGALPAFAVTLTLSLPSGVTGNTTVNLGNISPGTSATANTSLTASIVGPISVVANAESLSYGENFSGAASFQVTINAAAGASAPGAPANPSPANNASNVPTDGNLTWSSASGATSYDVYFGVQSNPSFYTTTTSLTTDFSGLSAGTRYYWQVVARNSAGNTSSPVWSFTTAASAPSSTSGLRFVPIAPCRLVDTRNAAGPLGGPIMSPQSTRTFPLRTHSCIAPAVPAAYSLNITVVPSEPLGYITAWPAGQTQPLTSVLNSLDGRIKANAAIVPAGADAAISLFATNNTHIIIDVNGYFVSDTGLAFYPVTPCRIADTRNATGSFGGPSMSPQQSRAFPVLSAPCGIPSTAQAYSLNATVIPKTASFGYLTLWPTGQSQPLASTLNAVTGTITANAAIVPAGSSGQVSAFVTDSSDLILDINGYFAPPGNSGALTFQTVTPCRIIDTRLANGTFGGPALLGGQSRNIPVSSAPACASSTVSAAQAYSLNATVVPSGAFGYLSMWPAGQSQPVVSTLNALDGALTSNAAIVPAASAGAAINVFGSSSVHLILDLNGVFVP